MEKLSLDFSVKIKVSTKPEPVHSNKLVLHYLFQFKIHVLGLWRPCWKFSITMLICRERCSSKV